MNKRQRIAQVVLNIMVIAELFISMYFARKDPGNFTPVFFKYLFSMIIPTLILGRIVIKRFRTKETRPETPDYITEEKIEENKVVKDLTEEFSAVARDIKKPKILTGGDIQLDQISKWKGLAGKTASLLLIIVVISLIDSCQAKFRQPIDVLDVIPGASAGINGQLSEKVQSIEDLTYVSSSELIEFTITELYSGFWFGVPGWSGLLKISPDIKQGEYSLKVMPKAQKAPVSQKPPFVFRIKVHKDNFSLLQSSTSFIKRYSGVSPWWIIAFFSPMTIFALFIVFLLSKKMEYLMAKGGEAEVFWIKAGTAACEIAFGLGTKHGVKPGDRLTVFNKSGQPIARVEVQKSSETDSVAIAGFDSGVRAGYIVSIK